MPYYLVFINNRVFNGILSDRISHFKLKQHWWEHEDSSTLLNFWLDNQSGFLV